MALYVPGVGEKDTDKIIRSQQLVASQTTTNTTAIALCAPIASPSFTGTANFAGAVNANLGLNVNGAPTNFSTQVNIAYAGPTIALSDIGTSYCFAQFQNAGATNTLRVGSETTTGGALVSGSAGNSGVISMAQNNSLHLGTNNAIRMTISGAGDATFLGAATSTGPTSGIGYATGAGGTVTQATNRTTAVTLNKVSGAITLFSQVNTAISQATAQSFTVNNSTVAATDVIIVNQKSGTDKYEIFVTNVGSGTFQITNYAVAGTTNEAPVFNFAVIKAVNA